MAIKTTHYDFPDELSWTRLWSYFYDIIVLTGNDVLYALIVGGLAHLSLKATRSHPKVHRAVWMLLLSYCLLSVFFAVASVRVYEILRTPLTYPLLRLGSDLSNMSSSVGKFVTPRLVLALVGAPLGYYLSVAASRWLVKACPWKRFRSAQVCSLMVAFVWFGYAHHELSGWDNSEKNYGLTLNSHYTLAASCVNALFGPPVNLADSFPPEYLGDFQSAREQPTSSRPTAGLKRGPKNVIVVVCESVGIQQLSLYGSRFKTWPRMEKEAAHSLVFDNYYSHITDTANSLYSLTLSAYPALTWKESTEEHPDAAGSSAATVLKSHGYRTAFISAGYNEWASQDKFLAKRGYDVIKDANDARRAGSEELNSWGVEDRCMVDMVLGEVDQAQQAHKPFYVFSWTQATHHPFEPGPSWEKFDFLKEDESYAEMSADLNNYLNGLYELDKQLSRLFSELRKRNLADDTIVIITGDHGEAFGWPRPDNRAHSQRVYEENVHVPLMIWSPALYQSPARSRVCGAHVDLSPTILDLLDIPAPEAWHGRSLLNPAHPSRAYFYGVLNYFFLGVRDQKYKYIFNATLAEEELYDLEQDSLEHHNLASSNPELCRPMRQRVAAWVHYQKAQ